MLSPYLHEGSERGEQSAFDHGGALTEAAEDCLAEATTRGCRGLPCGSDDPAHVAVSKPGHEVAAVVAGEGAAKIGLRRLGM
jgi:hypothetical protein